MKYLLIFIMFFLALPAQAEESNFSAFTRKLSDFNERYQAIEKAEEERFDSFREIEKIQTEDEARQQKIFTEKPTPADDQYRRLKTPKAKVQYDTWGRNRGQTKSSEDVLKGLMQPAKKD